MATENMRKLMCASVFLYKTIPWRMNFLQKSILLAFMCINKTVQPFACRNRVTGVFQASTVEKYSLSTGYVAMCNSGRSFNKNC